MGNLQFRAAVTLHGISSFHFITDGIFVLKFKKVKLQILTVSGDGFCNVPSYSEFVQNLWLVSHLFILLYKVQ